MTNPLNPFICPYCGKEKDRPRANQKTCGKPKCKKEHHRKTINDWHKKHPKLKQVKNRDTFIGRHRYSKKREEAELKSQKFACFLDKRRPLPAQTLQFFSVEKFVREANRILGNSKED